ncbi:UNVERIFIED_CONTAM: hypothetical protein Sradi_0467100 [Sesamum radiatum]|uniref:Uncharacterized protein n=1 Tax=Sesamum radiatum TaxID=300843 RepID=A0AAW2W6W6_SESRA
MTANNRRSIKELNTPNSDQQPLCIIFTDAKDDFELKSGLIHLLPSFHGLVGEDPHKYLKEFHVVCAGMKPHGITDEQLYLRASIQSHRSQPTQPGTCSSSTSSTKFSQLAAQSSRKLPSQTEVNPRENVSAMTLWSGKELQPVEPTSTTTKEGGKSLKNTDSHTDKLDSNFVPPTSSNIGAFPFPYRMSKSKEDELEREILDTFKKELCTNKRKLKDKERIIFGKNVSAVINRKLPKKCKNSGMFTLPCIIGDKRIERAMLDLGASINVMPYPVHQALNLSTQDTNVIIQLADRSYVRPMSLVEDVLVKVNDLLFSVDFYVLKMGTKGLNNPASILLVVHDVLEEELVGTELDLIMDLDKDDECIEFIGEVVTPSQYFGTNHTTAQTNSLQSILQAPILKLKALPNYLQSLIWVFEKLHLPPSSKNW